ncbi:hypothetical protein HanPSC8_Chr01g0042561 [Helianthus annuus]|nr:hypothetical protein HanPSC8_Chr01g0042561 [Helianthus annuus]
MHEPLFSSAKEEGSNTRKSESSQDRGKSSTYATWQIVASIRTLYSHQALPQLCINVLGQMLVFV